MVPNTQTMESLKSLPKNMVKLQKNYLTPHDIYIEPWRSSPSSIVIGRPYKFISSIMVAGPGYEHQSWVHFYMISDGHIVSKGNPNFRDEICVPRKIIQAVCDFTGKSHKHFLKLSMRNKDSIANNYTRPSKKLSVMQKLALCIKFYKNL